MRDSKLIPILWVLSLVLCPISVNAQATSGYCGRQMLHNVDSTNLQWNYDATTHVLTIYGAGPMKDYDAETKAPWYAWRNNIQYVVIRDSVTSVGAYAMYQVAMDSVYFGCNIDSIAQHAFDGCTQVTSAHWNVRAYPDPQLYIHLPLYPCHSKMTSFTIGDSVQRIPAYLCHGMSNVHHLHIPKRVSYIGDYAFRYMSALDSISVDGNNVFYDSRNECNALIETSTDNLLLGCSKTQIPNTIRRIESCAFRNVRGLKEVIIPSSVTYIGTEAFNGCQDLDSLVLPSQLTSIEDYTFQDCISLDSVLLPDKLKYIGIRAFANCKGLQSITLPESLDSLARYTFSGCPEVQYINCYAINPPTIHETSLEGITCPVYVPCPSLENYRTAPVWEDMVDHTETQEGVSDTSRISGMFDFVLTTLSNNDAWGTATVYQEPDCETNAVVSAEARTGYLFVEWQDAQGQTVSVEAKYEFYVDEDVTLTAIFRQNTEGLDEVDARTQVWVVAHDVFVRPDSDGQAVLYDMTGREVDTCKTYAGKTTSLHATTAGIYVAVINGQQRKVMIQ